MSGDKKTIEKRSIKLIRQNALADCGVSSSASVAPMKLSRQQ